ncbi:MAG: transcriptional repressor [Clostridia bacterium]|nr:transcriptional repressor [Clostridia bacterium]
MGEYKTEQRKQLIEFMTKYSELSLSVDGWVEKMKKELHESFIPSRSTVYRTMLKLEKQGRVIRCVEGASHTCNYQIAVCHEHHHHLHLKCVGCGALIHMSHEASELLNNTILKDNNFNVDKNQTVIYGLCAECK